MHLGAFGNFSRTGDVNDAAAEFKRTIYSLYLQDDWRVNDQLNAVMGVRMDIFDGGSPDRNQNFVNRYGFDNSTGFDDVNPVLLPRIGLTYDMDDFSIFLALEDHRWRRHLLGRRSAGLVRQRLPEQRLRFRGGHHRGGRLPAGPIDVVVNGQFTGFRNASARTESTKPRRASAYPVD